MLLALHIKNLAVVEDADLTFGPGLNALTGSTGAGKSLILSAVNLLLGERVSSRVIRRGAEKAIIQGKFRLPQAQPDMSLPMFDKEGRITLRREVHRSGRSYSWIQDKPATLKELHEMCVSLIEPHGQNEQMRLKPEVSVLYDFYRLNLDFPIFQKYT